MDTVFKVYHTFRSTTLLRHHAANRSTRRTKKVCTKHFRIVLFVNKALIIFQFLCQSFSPFSHNVIIKSSTKNDPNLRKKSPNVFTRYFIVHTRMLIPLLPCVADTVYKLCCTLHGNQPCLYNILQDHAEITIASLPACKFKSRYQRLVSHMKL